MQVVAGLVGRGKWSPAKLTDRVYVELARTGRYVMHCLARNLKTRIHQDLFRIASAEWGHRIAELNNSGILLAFHSSLFRAVYPKPIASPARYAPLCPVRTNRMCRAAISVRYTAAKNEGGDWCVSRSAQPAGAFGQRAEQRPHSSVPHTNVPRVDKLGAER